MNDTKTVSGAIVHITDADEAPLVKCLVDITPKQSGTGTPSPSNVRAISGWESVSVNVVGKNVLNNNRQSVTLYGVTFTRNEDGSFVVNGTATSTVYFLMNTSGKYKAKAGITYRLTGCPSGGSTSTYVIYNDNHGLLDSGSGADYTPNADDEWNFFIRIASGTTVNNLVFKPMLRIKTDGDTDTYEPYTGTTTTTSLGRTVYGGTLDVVTGVLTVDRAMVTYNGSENWRMETGAQYTGSNFYIAKPSGTGNEYDVFQSNITNKFTSSMSTAQDGVCISAGYFNCILGNILGINNVADFKTWLSSHNMQIVYPLATPQTYTLTGQEIETLVGQNNIWADSGDIVITYHTDTLGIYNKIYINGRPYFRPNDFQLAREDVYAGEYTSCTGKLIADKIGWKYSDLPMKWDILPDEDLVYLTTLIGAFDLIFRDSDGQHTETVIRKGFTNTPTRITGPEGSKIWTGIEMEVAFLNTHPKDEE